MLVIVEDAVFNTPEDECTETAALAVAEFLNEELECIDGKWHIGGDAVEFRRAPRGTGSTYYMGHSEWNS